MAVKSMRGGVKVPADAARIDRATEWGNPFKLNAGETRGSTIKRYKHWLFHHRPDLVVPARTELRGKDLYCWCAPQACHGDVLDHIANCDEEEWERIKNWINEHMNQALENITVVEVHA